MGFSEWNEYKLSDIVKITMGQSPKGISCNREQRGRPLLNGPTEFGIHHPEPTQFTEDVKKLARKGDLLFCVRGSTTGRMNWAEQDYAIGRGIAAIAPIHNDTDRFIKAMIDYKLPKILQMATGSTFPNVSKSILNDLVVKVPNVTEMVNINNIFKCIEDKIQINNQINKKLEEVAQAIFKQWFVDFEFPNENGESYKSSGGEMVESEMGMIPKGWEVKSLRDIIELSDSKRIPLSKKEREKREKIYPYYGAASLMDYVDDYIFDGLYVLLGEDGTVIDEEGYPVLQYVWGKFWSNNHAHVLKGKKGISEDFIYILLKNTNVSSAITGAVQLKINQKNLKGIRSILPKNSDLISSFSNIINKSFGKIRNNSDENERLIFIRDTLLPKLMSGEIRVPLDN